MNFRKANNITGWAVFFIASLTYILTAEKSGSFWDCGEFVASAYKLQLPHPPGAPLFTLIGRFFIILFGDNPATAAKAVNVMSAVASGFTILFLFWTITHFARKLVVSGIEEPAGRQIGTIMAAGVVGALAYTFSDSFWYSAVEGEVYALSSFFTALVFWAMLKWERADDLAGKDILLRNRADRWIVFIFFTMGLSIGVHLLNLLVIPAIVMIYYYKRYKYTRNGAIWAFIIGCVITGVVQVAVIQWTIKLAGKFDILFVNEFNLPFFSGFVFFFFLLGVLVWYGLKVSIQRGWAFLRLGLWCFIFMMLGYSTYVTTMERSSANPAIDMNNVDNPMSLVYYLGREQYGSQPILYGPHFSADYKIDENTGYVAWDSAGMKYTKGKDRYIPIGREQEVLFERDDYMLFPRVWDRSNDQYHADTYAEWLDIPRVQDPRGQKQYADPSYGDNIHWFISYQMGFMYWRYFMWNFAGKQNDVQGNGNKRDGNWISGIPFIDNPRLGDQAQMPDSLKRNKAHNTLFLLPFILGVIGCMYQFLRNRKDWIISFLLFSFTGLAIVIYLNQPGNQPRERDYAYVGSFYAFAIWIGLAVVALVRMAREQDDKTIFKNVLSYGSAATFLVMLLSNTTTTMSGAFISSLLATGVFAAVTALLYFAVKAASGGSENRSAGSVVAFGLCLIAPLIMASQEWNDHDRSQKTLAPDIARNYLESCAPNGIVFTFGDNDTYPLWYAQEVEGVRPDLRIINYSLLGIDWYANQLRYKVNQSDPIDIIWSAGQIEGHKREYIRFQEDPRVNKEAFYPLYDVMKNVLGEGDNVNSYPVKRFTVPVDTTFARSSGLVGPGDVVLPQLGIEVGDNLSRADLIILNIIAANNWKRPIYFTSPFGELGFGQYLRKDGLTYRLVPVQNSFPQQNWEVDKALRENRLGGTAIRDNNTDTMYRNMMEKFRFGGAEQKGTYFDEENRRHLLSIRSTFAEAAGNMADKGRKQEALNLLQKAEAGISTENLPYAQAARFNGHNQTALIYLEAAYKAGNRELAQKVSSAIRSDLASQKKYYDYLRAEQEEHFQSLATEAQVNELMTQVFETVEKKYNQQAPPAEHPEAVKPASDSAGKP